MTHLDAITLPVLQDLLRPALEAFDHILDHGLSDSDARVLAARVKTLRGKRDELSDYVALLTRYAEAGARRIAQARPPPSEQNGFHLSATNALSRRSVTWTAATGSVRGESAAILHGHHMAERAEIHTR
jgi:hypothetical protein